MTFHPSAHDHLLKCNDSTSLETFASDSAEAAVIAN